MNPWMRYLVWPLVKFLVAFIIVQVIVADLDLGVDDRAHAQLLDHPAEVRFGDAVAVVRRFIEVVDPELDRPRSRAHLLLERPADHQAGGPAASESEL